MGWTNAGRRKAAAGRRGKHLSVKTRAKIGASLKGRHHRVSATARKHMSEARKGKKHPHRGHAMSALTRKKLSAKLKGRKGIHHKMSAAARAKLSAALKGKKHPHKGSHVHHHVTRRKRTNISHKVRKRIHRLVHTSGHVSGKSNQKVIAKLARRRVTTTANKRSNNTVLQIKLHRNLLPPKRGRTNRRLILNAYNRHRRRP